MISQRMGKWISFSIVFEGAGCSLDLKSCKTQKSEHLNYSDYASTVYLEPAFEALGMESLWPNNIAWN